MFLHSTSKGRVVYDRKPHAFSDKDVIRITKSSDVTYFQVPAVDWEAFMTAYNTMFINQMSHFKGLGGGTFGGGGATRAFDVDNGEGLEDSINNGLLVTIRGV